MSRLVRCRSRAEGRDGDDREGNVITVQGPKGQLKRQFPAEMQFEQADGQVQVHPSDRPEDAPGAARPEPRLLNNMVTGVSQGFTRVLDVEGVGYRATMMGKNLVMLVGYSHPVEIVAAAGITFEVDKTGPADHHHGHRQATGRPDGRPDPRSAAA